MARCVAGGYLGIGMSVRKGDCGEPIGGDEKRAFDEQAVDINKVPE